MQDICEKALVDKLKELNATVGVVVLMEVEMCIRDRKRTKATGKAAGRRATFSDGMGRFDTF